eukprot:CAMPEP_0181294174 /NCGR_PEP_ID=MMETSP1101-20121128/3454_1 /TAXON_ID=46948 /ORGANISM="Rhodomonas abbreviata, Strain Caron Lab Isolate" /LENGTH=150 /DNA_ID=CAMNT_0023398803 /DNA_START=362 /DNA_END=814 /DNA_ORIENTATION=+
MEGGSERHSACAPGSAEFTLKAAPSVHTHPYTFMFAPCTDKLPEGHGTQDALSLSKYVPPSHCGRLVHSDPTALPDAQGTLTILYAPFVLRSTPQSRSTPDGVLGSHSIGPLFHPEFVGSGFHHAASVQPHTFSGDALAAPTHTAFSERP